MPLPELVSKASASLRQSIFKRDGRVCWYCGDDQARMYIVEHIVPRRRGGPDHPANLVVACQSCNSRKGMQVWLPQNFEHITAEYPAWQAEVRALAVEPGDKRISGPSVTTAPGVARATVGTSDKRQVGFRMPGDVYADFVAWCHANEYAVGPTAGAALREYMARQGEG